MSDAPTPSDGTTPPAATPTERLLSLLELAEKGSRELDAELARIQGLRVASDDPFWHVVTGLDGYDALRPVPPYTTSLDAARTLVPEGRRWSVSASGHEGDNGATVSLLGYPFTAAADFKGATPALALCIAALKARAQ